MFSFGVYVKQPTLAEVSPKIRERFPEAVDKILNNTLPFNELYIIVSNLFNHNSGYLTYQKSLNSYITMSIITFLKTVRDNPNKKDLFLEFMNHTLDHLIVYQDNRCYEDPPEVNLTIDYK